MLKAGHAGERAHFVGAPAGEITRGVVILEREAGLDPLHARGAELDGIFVAIDHRGDGDLLPGEDGGHGGDELLRFAGKAAEQKRLGVNHVPPLAASAALIPVVVDADLRQAAVVKHHGGLPDLGPGHDGLPFARVKTAAPDVVLQRLRGVRAFEVGDLGVGDDVCRAIHILDANDEDVRGFGDDFAEGIRDLNVGAGGEGEAREEEQERGDSGYKRGARAPLFAGKSARLVGKAALHVDEERVLTRNPARVRHDYFNPSKPFRATSAHGLFGDSLRTCCHCFFASAGLSSSRCARAASQRAAATNSG